MHYKVGDIVFLTEDMKLAFPYGYTYKLEEEEYHNQKGLKIAGVDMAQELYFVISLERAELTGTFGWVVSPDDIDNEKTTVEKNRQNFKEALEKQKEDDNAPLVHTPNDSMELYIEDAYKGTFRDRLGKLLPESLRTTKEPDKRVEVPGFVVEFLREKGSLLTLAEKIKFLVIARTEERFYFGDASYFYEQLPIHGEVSSRGEGKALADWANEQDLETLLNLINGYKLLEDKYYILNTIGETLKVRTNTGKIVDSDGFLVRDLCPSEREKYQFTKEEIGDHYWLYARPIEIFE